MICLTIIVRAHIFLLCSIEQTAKSFPSLLSPQEQFLWATQLACQELVLLVTWYTTWSMGRREWQASAMEEVGLLQSSLRDCELIYV